MLLGVRSSVLDSFCKRQPGLNSKMRRSDVCCRVLILEGEETSFVHADPRFVHESVECARL